MTTTIELIELAKKSTGITSDYGIAKLIGVTSQKISNWKAEKSEANAINTLKLIKAAGLTIDDALKIMSKEAQNTRPDSSSNADRVYIMLNSLIIKIKAKLLNIAFKHNNHAICVYLLKTN